MPVKTKPKPLPRQQQLPGVEDRKIFAIENAAMAYAEIRDERQDLTKREVELKADLLRLMHKLGRTEYKRDGISVTVVMEEENVKVRVKSADEPDEEEEESPDGEEGEERDEEESQATPF